MATPFLTAEWRKLAMANYAVDKSLLAPYLPARTELDLWNGKCYVSLVGFMFLNTTVKGIRVPFHVNFEEVNLRFYVRCPYGDNWRRGVVFIREIVAKRAVSFIANTFFNENYTTMPMNFSSIAMPASLNVEYRWKGKHWNIFGVACDKKPALAKPGSEEEFITEHYWGYTKSGPNAAFEYEVVHPKWEIYPTRSHRIDVDFGEVYGEKFAFLSKEKPTSVFLVEGSEVLVKDGQKI